MRAFDDARVSLRPRYVQLADECDWVHSHGLSAPLLPGCRPAPSLLTKALGLTRPIMADLEQLGVPQWFLASWRLQLLGGGQRTCFSADDMFAAVPAHLADAYFLRTGVLEEQVALRGGGAARLPLGWQLNQSAETQAAAAATYGSQLSYLAYSRVCRYLPFAAGAEACAFYDPARCPSNNTNLLVWGQRRGRFGTACFKSGCAAEGLITSRLHSRLVPVQFGPLPYNALVYGGTHGPQCSAARLKQLQQSESTSKWSDSQGRNPLKVELKACYHQSAHHHC